MPWGDECIFLDVALSPRNIDRKQKKGERKHENSYDGSGEAA